MSFVVTPKDVLAALALLFVGAFYVAAWLLTRRKR